jgi:hypothetical protein
LGIEGVSPLVGGGAVAPVRVGIAKAGDGGASSFDMGVERSNQVEVAGFVAAASWVASPETGVKVFCEGKEKVGF